MDVSDKAKSDYRKTSVHKNLNVFFPELDYTVPHERIYAESMHLKESILEKKSIEFVGCIASMFSVQIYKIPFNIKGKKIQISISTDDTEDIPLFNGVVDSVVMQTNKNYKKVTAYDELYTKGNIDVAAWYNGLTFPITLKDFRDKLFTRIGIVQQKISLPNDDLVIDKKYEPKTLKSLNVIKAICQINGAFGIINRDGIFEYRILGRIVSGSVYPSLYLFPDVTVFPSKPSVTRAVSVDTATDIPAENFAFYKKVDYEEFEVKPVDKLTIRQTENDAGVTYGSGTNNYIIQGNMFTYGLPESMLQTVASNIYPNVQGFTYHPFKSDNNGLPFLECGKDAVSYNMIDYDKSSNDNLVYKQQDFYILNRELKGIQSLRDTYGANGEEYQTEFITDLQTQIDTIKQNTKQDVEEVIKDYDFTPEFADFTYDKATIDEMIGSGGGGGFNVESVSELPANPDSNTIYLIQGKVMVE